MSEGSKSVIGYLEENTEGMIKYFMYCKKENKEPNYSEFCRTFLNGDTREGVSFNSIRVKRSEITAYLRSKYKLWLELI